MRIGLFGNTNNLPLLLAFGLRELGHEVLLAVNRKELVHRPESKFPEFERRYPHWILDCSDLTEDDFVWTSPRLDPALNLLTCGSDGLVLNDLGHRGLQRRRPPAGAAKRTVALRRGYFRFRARAQSRRRPVDSNPYGVLVLGGDKYVTDAGGNDLLRVAANGDVSLVATFPPASNGAEPVPTEVERGPDGARYVSLLTGAPFTTGVAGIHKIVSGQPQLAQGGFKTITDFTFGPDGSMYVCARTRNLGHVLWRARPANESGAERDEDGHHHRTQSTHQRCHR